MKCQFVSLISVLPAVTLLKIPIYDSAKHHNFLRLSDFDSVVTITRLMNNDSLDNSLVID